MLRRVVVFLFVWALVAGEFPVHAAGVSVVGVVTISNEEHHVEQALQKVLAKADNILGPLIVSHAVDLL